MKPLAVYFAGCLLRLSIVSPRPVAVRSERPFLSGFSLRTRPIIHQVSDLGVVMRVDHRAGEMKQDSKH